MHDTSPTTKLLYTLVEAAELLGIGRTTLYRLIDSGDIVPLHIGRLIRISASELAAYIGRLAAAARAGSPEPTIATSG